MKLHDTDQTSQLLIVYEMWNVVIASPKNLTQPIWPAVVSSITNFWLLYGKYIIKKTIFRVECCSY